MLAWLHAVGDPGASPDDLLSWARNLSQIGFGTGVVVLCFAFYRRLIVPFSWVKDLLAQIAALREEHKTALATMRADYETRLAAKDALIAHRDSQVEAATKTIVEDVVPAVVRSQLTMERVEAELRARH